MKNKWILRCLQLAKKGSGNVSPNPLVGCVIVLNEQIIGEGYHQKIGQAHAEVNAIHSVKDPALLKKSTLYVNLEPCAHFGLTPPCANLIIEKGIPKVVIANADPFEKVDGRGIEILKNAGIEVELGIEADAGRWLNRRFFTFHEKKRPYIILKFAQSKDGYLDINRQNGERGIHWITSPASKSLTHLWRSKEDAILIGTNTAITDNPSLTTRAISGKNPIRLVIDQKMQIDKTASVFSADAKTVVFNNGLSGSQENLHFVALNFEQNIVQQIIKWCFEQKIQSVIVEGGAFTLNQFVALNLWDEARILTGSVLLNEGLSAPKITGNLIDSYKFGSDQVDIIANAI